MLATLCQEMMIRKSKSNQKSSLKTQECGWTLWVVTTSQMRAMVEESTKKVMINLVRM